MAATEPDNALVTIARVKQFAFGDAVTATTNDAQIALLIGEVSAFIESYTGRTYRHAASDITEYFDVESDEQRDIYVSTRPITTLSHVYEDADRDYGAETELTVADDDIILYATDGFVRRNGFWAMGDQVVKIVYRGGYSTVASVPQNISGVAVDICGYCLKQAFDGGARIGISSVSKGDGSISGFTQNLPGYIREKLDLLKTGVGLVTI